VAPSNDAGIRVAHAPASEAAGATVAAPLPPAGADARQVNAVAPSTAAPSTATGDAAPPPAPAPPAPSPAPAPAASLAINTDRAPATQAAGTATPAVSEHRTTAIGPAATTSERGTPASPDVAGPPGPAVLGPTAPATSDSVSVSRADVNAALANFTKLTNAVHGSFSPNGVVIERVAAGTIFQRIGLRAGDVITAVDGARLRSLDDAANVYAKVSTAKAITAQIVREGASMTLHVAIR